MFISAKEIGIFVAPYEKKLIATILLSYKSETDSLSQFLKLWYAMDNKYKNPKSLLQQTNHYEKPRKRGYYKKNLIKPGIHPNIPSNHPHYKAKYRKLLKEKKYATQAPL